MDQTRKNHVRRYNDIDSQLAGPCDSDTSVFLVLNWLSRKTCYVVKRLSKCWSLLVAGTNCFSRLINISVQLFETPQDRATHSGLFLCAPGQKRAIFDLCVGLIAFIMCLSVGRHFLREFCMLLHRMTPIEYFAWSFVTNIDCHFDIHFSSWNHFIFIHYIFLMLVYFAAPFTSTATDNELELRSLFWFKLLIQINKRLKTLIYWYLISKFPCL